MIVACAGFTDTVFGGRRALDTAPVVPPLLLGGAGRIDGGAHGGDGGCQKQGFNDEGFQDARLRVKIIVSL